MESIKAFNDLYGEIKSISDNIIRRTLILSKKVMDKNYELYEEIKERVTTQVTDDELREIMAGIILGWGKDSQEFIGCQNPVEYSQDSGTWKIINKDEYFYNIWNGDTYGEPEIGGLQECKKDFEEQQSKISRKSLVEETLGIVNKK